jgi:hypothetical protein
MKQRKKTSAKPPTHTGAPPAYFLKTLTVTSSVSLLIEHTRKEREFLVRQSTEEISDRIWLELLELAERIRKIRLVNGKPENPANDLAVVAILAAKILEELATTDAKIEIMLAAARKNLWPVNLRLGVRKGKVVLVGADKAKTYLTSIRLGENPPRILKNLQNPEASPFSKAAERLYNALLDWRDLGAWRGEITGWAKKLLLLDVPITSENVNDWWSVAKTWMDEQWVTHNEFFKPLIKQLKLDCPNYTPSMVKRRVIDDSLKKAFKALPSEVVVED